MTGGLGKPHIPRDHRLKYLISKKTAQIGCDLLGKGRPVVVHRQKDPFDLQRRVNGAPEAHQRVEKLGNSFDRQVLTLDRNQDRVGCS
jgi:hypothetical protein